MVRGLLRPTFQLGGIRKTHNSAGRRKDTKKTCGSRGSAGVGTDFWALHPLRKEEGSEIQGNVGIKYLSKRRGSRKNIISHKSTGPATLVSHRRDDIEAEKTKNPIRHSRVRGLLQGDIVFFVISSGGGGQMEGRVAKENSKTTVEKRLYKQSLPTR